MLFTPCRWIFDQNRLGGSTLWLWVTWDEVHVITTLSLVPLAGFSGILRQKSPLLHTGLAVGCPTVKIVQTDEKGVPINPIIKKRIFKNPLFRQFFSPFRPTTGFHARSCRVVVCFCPPWGRFPGETSKKFSSRKGAPWVLSRKNTGDSHPFADF